MHCNIIMSMTSCKAEINFSEIRIITNRCQFNHGRENLNYLFPLKNNVINSSCKNVIKESIPKNISQKTAN